MVDVYVLPTQKQKDLVNKYTNYYKDMLFQLARLMIRLVYLHLNLNKHFLIIMVGLSMMLNKNMKEW